MPTQQEFEELESALQHLKDETFNKIAWLSPMLPQTDSNFNKPYFTQHNEQTYYYRPALYCYFGYERIGTAQPFFALAPFGTWHILHNSKSICSYIGASDHDEKLIQNLQVLAYETVKQVVFVREKLNLFIEFNNHYWLGIFHMEHCVSGFQYTISEVLGQRGGRGIQYDVTNGAITVSEWIS